MPFADVAALDLAQVAFTAAVDAEGKLSPIGGFGDKLDGLLLQWLGPRVHTLVVCAEQEELKGLPEFRPDPLCGDSVLVCQRPERSLHILKARDLAEAVKLLRVEAETRWGNILDYFELLDHRYPADEFVGRGWLIDLLERLLADEVKRVITVTAGPGFGKSAFSAAMIRRSLTGNGWPMAFHVFRRDRPAFNSPEAALTSLTAQLCRRFALPVPAGDTAAGRFDKVLTAAGRVASPGRPIILWIDGLDESGGFTLPTDTLPANVRLVLTSRDDRGLEFLTDGRHVRHLKLEKQGADLSGDIREYLERGCERKELRLAGDFLDELTDKCAGNITLAELFLNESPEVLLAWQRDRSKVPRGGLDGWLKREWAFLVDRLKPEKIKEEVAKVALGLLALAREPVGRPLLDTALERASDVERVGPVKRDDIIAHLPDILGHARGFFRHTDDGRFEFFHPYFAEFLANRLSHPAQAHAHTVWATLDPRAGGLDRDAARYAGKHYFAHVLRAGNAEAAVEWFGQAFAHDQLKKAVADVAEFLVEGERR